MKSAIATLSFILLLSFAALAQNSAAPSLVLNHHPGTAAAKPENFSWGPPPTGPNILFYGGDTNVFDPNVQGFVNGNTVIVSAAATYGAVLVPATGHYVVTGVFFNQIATSSTFDPATATYDFRTGLSDGVGGTSIASGSGPQSAHLTGRSPFGYAEYRTSVALVSPMTAPNGETVWINESSQCTNGNDPNCTEEFFVSNTTQKTGSINGNAQPAGQMFLNSSYFGYSWTNWCDASLGQNAQQCADLSFGIYGHR